MTIQSQIPQAQSQHVKPGDEVAEYVDRRNQDGQAFDDNVNEHTLGNDNLKSNTINEQNVYTSPENAQKRTINPDGSIPSIGSE